MHREGHIGIGLLVYAPIGYLLMDAGLMVPFGLGMVAMAFWSIAPDVDMVLPIRHRGPTHTVGAAVVAGIITAIAGGYLVSTGVGAGQADIISYATAAAYGLAIGFTGVVSHLVGDVLTMMGIRPWKPFSARKHALRVTYAKNDRWNQGLLMLGGCATVGSMVIPIVA